MSVLQFAMRPDRVAQFIRVSRHEGFRVAFGKARTQISNAARGQVPTVVQEPSSPQVAPLEPPRFARTGVWRDLAQGDAFNCTAAPAVHTRARTVAMIGDLNLQQCRKYRVEQLDEIFGLSDIVYRFSHYEDIPRCLDSLQTATHLVLYRLARNDLNTMYLYEARRLKIPVLYDIDDPLFSVPAYETYSNMDALPAEMKTHFLSEAPLYLDMMAMTDALSFSTPGLVKHAGHFLPRPTFLRRNFADRESLDAGARAAGLAKRDTTRFTMAVASGSRGHSADFKQIADQVWALLRQDPGHRLRILGHMDALDAPDDVTDQIETVPFADYPTYLKKLAEADCALMPLTDDTFNQCKSAVRVIDAASVGVTSLVPSVGDLDAPVVHGKTGFVCSAGDDWTEALDLLASDRRIARRMGRAARKGLEATWRARQDLPVMDPAMIDWVKA